MTRENPRLVLQLGDPSVGDQLCERLGGGLVVQFHGLRVPHLDDTEQYTPDHEVFNKADREEQIGNGLDQNCDCLSVPKSLAEHVLPYCVSVDMLEVDHIHDVVPLLVVKCRWVDLLCNC